MRVVKSHLGSPDVVCLAGGSQRHVSLGSQFLCIAVLPSLFPRPAARLPSPPHAAEHAGDMSRGGMKKNEVPSICTPPQAAAGKMEGHAKSSCASNSSFSTCPLEGPTRSSEPRDKPRLGSRPFFASFGSLASGAGSQRARSQPDQTPNLRNLFHVLYCLDGWRLALQHH